MIDQTKRRFVVVPHEDMLVSREPAEVLQGSAFLDPRVAERSMEPDKACAGPDRDMANPGNRILAALHYDPVAMLAGRKHQVATFIDRFSRRIAVFEPITRIERLAHLA